MKKIPLFRTATLLMTASACGCVTVPPAETQASYGSAVGDRTRISLDEIVVSLPLKGSTGPYQNLHVALAAAVNPVKTTIQSPYTVADILQRLDARISARVLETLLDTRGHSVDDAAALRNRIAHEAQSVVNEAMQHWQHGTEYEVKVLVVSLYWTDGSVGRPAASRRVWW